MIERRQSPPEIRLGALVGFFPIMRRHVDVGVLLEAEFGEVAGIVFRQGVEVEFVRIDIVA